MSPKLLVRIALPAAALGFAAFLSSQPAPPERVGPLPGGAFLLNSGWKLDPIGKQVPLDTLPMSSALSKDGKHLLVLNGGYRPPSISVIDTATGTVTSSTPVADGWLGLTFNPAGDRVYVGGGSKAAVFEFAFENGKLTPARTFATVPAATHKDNDFIGDVAMTPDGRLLYAAELYKNSIAVINPQSGMVISRVTTGRRPYRILFAHDGKSFFVTHWADGTLGQYDTATGNQTARVTLGAHPTDIVWRNGPSEGSPDSPTWTSRLFVSAAHSNNVYALGLNSGSELKVVEVINISMTPRQPLGMTPSALALSPDGNRLFIACSDGNVAAVANVAHDRTRVEGFIPAGWYPTAVRVLADNTLVIINGKGLRSYPNPLGPTPIRRAEPVHLGVANEYFVGRMQTGTASWIPPFTTQQLDQWTQKAMSNSPYRDEQLDETMPTPIQHVLYIVRENRTYDQVLGDMKEGNGDPSLALFTENITPNLHKLAREFVLFDNFYVNADVSADGHNWSTADIAPDYVQKMWPNHYSKRRGVYDFEEQDIASQPPAGYLWTSAALAGVSIRNYGYMVNEIKKAPPTGEPQITGVRDPVLAKYTNNKYRGFDLDYPDIDRAKIFLADLAEFEKTGEMPRLMVMRLGNDHTYGSAAGKLHPYSSAADNDYAVGQIVEGISKSRFWTNTVICILEDDAQNGPDHVDSHRSEAFLISAYTKRHTVDSTMYNTASMLRTIELILGLKPMTQFDASARPMAAAFQSKPDTSAYVPERPRYSLTEHNPPAAPAAKKDDDLKFDEADENDDDEMNDALWRAIKGTTPPPPVRSYFGK